jgi:hypothetical protein
LSNLGLYSEVNYAWIREGGQVVNCTKCGKENSDQDQFCTGCGAPLKETGGSTAVSRTLTDKRILGYAGLVTGIFVLVGLFTPWVSVSGWGVSASASAWDSVTNAKVAGGDGVTREAWAFLTLFGAILTVVGAVYALASPRTKLPWGLLGIGGVFALIGAIWGLSDIETGSALGMSVSYGAGLYLTLLGGILGLAVGSLALWFGAQKTNLLSQ